MSALAPMGDGLRTWARNRAARLADEYVRNLVTDDHKGGAKTVGRRAVPPGVGADVEVAAGGELLELYQREVGLDAGGVAVHDDADRAGRRAAGDVDHSAVAFFNTTCERERLLETLRDVAKPAFHARLAELEAGR